MAEQEKASWWKSLPGILTAATGFVAALSGLVAGLNQLGVFRREPPAPSTVSTTPALRDSVPQPLARADRAQVDTTHAPAASPQAHPPSPRPAAPAAAARPTAPARASDSASRRPPAGDTAATTQPSRLPTGTVLDLTVPKRTCAPHDGKQRFTARLAEPVKVAGATVLRANTTAVLHLRRGDSADGPLVRLDSLMAQDMAASVPAATVRVRRGTDGAACLRANARIRATLGGPITLRRR